MKTPPQFPPRQAGSPNFDKNFTNIFVATTGQILLQANSALSIISMTMQVSVDCTVQLAVNGQAITNSYSLKAGNIWSVQSRFLANNERLSLVLSSGSAKVEIVYKPGIWPAELLNLENRFYSPSAGGIIVGGILPLQFGGTGQDLSLTGCATCFLAQDAAHVISVRSLVSADMPNLLSYSGALSYLPNLVTRKILQASAAGDNDLYTVPAGKRAFAILSTWNATGGTIAHFSEVKIGGVYFRTGAAIAGLNNTAGTPFYLIVLEAGQSFALNCAALGLYIAGTVYEFDNTSFLKSYVLTAFAPGDNAFAAVPVGKKFAVQIGSMISTSGGAGTMAVVNNSGGSLAYTWNIVPSAGVVALANRIFVTAGIATGATSFASLNATLDAGDFFSINTTSAGSQIAWVTGSEY